MDLQTGLMLPEGPARAPRPALPPHLFYGRDCFHWVVLQPLPRVLRSQTIQRFWPDRGGRWRTTVGEGTRRSHDRESSECCIGLSFVQQRALKLERAKALRRVDRVKKVLTANLSSHLHILKEWVTGMLPPPIGQMSFCKSSASWNEDAAVLYANNIKRKFQRSALT